MRLPPPHGFSRSPVVRVTCSWYSQVMPAISSGDRSYGRVARDESGRVSVMFDAPYPGWTVISDRLAELLTAFADTRNLISRCSLEFADRFLLSPQDEIRSLFSLARYFPDTAESILTTKPIVCAGSSPVKETANEITLRYEKEKRLVLLDFHLYQISDSGIPAEMALSWFEAAHAEIHLLFDEIVSPEMISRLA